MMRRHRRATGLGIAAAMILLVPVVGCSTPKGPIRAKLWIGGFAHDFEPAAEVIAADLRERMPIDIEIVSNGGFLDAPDAEQLDVIVMHHCHESTEGVLTDSQKERLLELVRDGVGVVAIHASYYSFPDWDAYHELHGTKWTTHGDVGVTLMLRAVDTDHPITRSGPESCEVVTELYVSEPLADDCRVLVVAKEKGGGAEHPSVWTRTYGKGRVVTLLAGHGPDAFEVEGFQRWIAASTQWAAGRVER